MSDTDFDARTESHDTRRGWRHAWGLPPKPVPDAADAAVLDDISATLRGTGMGGALRIFAEAHQPLAVVVGHLAYLAQPVAHIFGRGAAQHVGTYGRLIESGALTERLAEDER